MSETVRVREEQLRIREGSRDHSNYSIFDSVSQLCVKRPIALVVVQFDCPLRTTTMAKGDDISKKKQQPQQQDKRDKNKAKRAPSDQPTQLIAPVDYAHIFKGGYEETRAASATKVKRTPSDTPTALIAPSDYEHIYHEESLDRADQHKKGAMSSKQVQASATVVKRVPSDTPTALIAPSDFQHIYRDESIHREACKVSPRPKKPSIQAENEFSARNAIRRKVAKSLESDAPSEDSSQERLPESIQRVVQKFIDKQPKSYTIHKQ